MRICLIKPNRTAYSETFIERHVQCLRRNHEVDVLFGYPLPSHSESDGALLPSPSLLERARRSLFRRVLKVNKDYFLERAFARRAREKRYDVVLAEFGTMGARIANQCKKMGIPLVVHFHGFDAYVEEIISEYAQLYAGMFSYAEKVIAVSGDMVKQLSRLGCPEGKIALKPYGVEIPESRAEPKKKEGVKVLAVGRFVDKKGPHLSILAFAKALSASLNARLIMAGDGPLLASCLVLVKALGIDSRVEFPGAVSSTRIDELLQEADVFLQHSLVAPGGDSEGTPVAILEASASALPVVSTRHAGIVEAVVDGKTGCLVPEGDIDGMARALVKLIDSASLRNEMGRAGVEHIQKHYSLNGEIEILQAILLEAAACRKP